MKLNKNKILITGGASGIGRGLAERFLQEDNQVIVCGRRENVLTEMTGANPAIITRVCDLEKATDRKDLYEWIRSEHSDLNVLINNAGIQNWMSPADGDFMDRAKKEIAINIEAPLHLIHLFSSLPALDTIVNVTSGLAYVPFTKVPVYSATKAFFHSITLSLRHLLKDKKIEVLEIIPPALKTDLGAPGLHDHAPEVGGFIDAIFSQLKEGKTELTHGFSEAMTKAGPADLQAAFNRLNP